MRLVFPHTAKSRIPRQFELDPNVEKAIIAGAGWLANIIVSSHKSLTDVEKTLQKDICEVDKNFAIVQKGLQIVRDGQQSLEDRQTEMQKELNGIRDLIKKRRWFR